MHRRQFLALGGAIVALIIAPAAAGAAIVTVRVEGKKHTLLGAKVVRTHTGSITEGGAPSGACPLTSAAGALDVATHHRWSGPWDSKYDEYFINTILGENDNGKSFFWEIFVNNVAAQIGVCGINLHSGDKLLFAAVPVSGSSEYPIALIAPSSATVGHRFKVKVVWFDAKGHAKPLAGAHVSGVATDSRGIAKIVAHHDGTLVLHADKHGYIRAAPVRVRVSG